MDFIQKIAPLLLMEVKLVQFIHHYLKKRNPKQFQYNVKDSYQAKLINSLHLAATLIKVIAIQCVLEMPIILHIKWQASDIS